MPNRRVLIVLSAALSVLFASGADAQNRRKERERERPPQAAPVDKRDTVVAAPGTPFHGRAYWHALGQCGGIYFKLQALYSDAAIHTKVVKPDAAANTRFSKQADEASRAATVYFLGAERFLVADRGLGKDEAILTFDPGANEAGERVRTIDAAVQAARPCPALLRTCHAAFPKMCPDGNQPAAYAPTDSLRIVLAPEALIAQRAD